MFRATNTRPGTLAQRRRRVCSVSASGTQSSSVVYRKYSLYEFLSNNINYLDSSAVIDSFYTACNFDNIGALFALNQKMTELADTAVPANKSTLLDKLTEAGAEVEVA